MWNLWTMIVLMCVWRGKRVAFLQQGKVVCIGTVMLISNDWLLLRDVLISGGHRALFMVGRNRIDGIWEYHQGDEKLITTMEGKIEEKDDEESSEEAAD